MLTIAMDQAIDEPIIYNKQIMYRTKPRMAVTTAKGLLARNISHTTSLSGS